MKVTQKGDMTEVKGSYEELSVLLVKELKGILCSNTTCEGLSNPSELTPDDITANSNLYKRLEKAMSILGAMKDYYPVVDVVYKCTNPNRE